MKQKDFAVLVIFVITAVLIQACSSQFRNRVSVNDMKSAIGFNNQAGMLSAQVAKLYGVLASEKINSQRKQQARDQLLFAQNEIDAIYNELLWYIPNIGEANLQQPIESANEYWQRIKKNMLTTPNINNFRKIIDLNDKLIYQNAILTKRLERRAIRKPGHLVSITTKQNLLVNKLARDYLAASMDIDKAEHLENILTIANEFERWLLYMQDYPDNTAQIKGVLNSIAKMEWRHIYQSLNECVVSEGTEFHELMMFVFSGKVQEKTERLVSLYLELYDTEQGLKLATE